MKNFLFLWNLQTARYHGGLYTTYMNLNTFSCKEFLYSSLKMQKKEIYSNSVCHLYEKKFFIHVTFFFRIICESEEFEQYRQSQVTKVWSNLKFINSLLSESKRTSSEIYSISYTYTCLRYCYVFFFFFFYFTCSNFSFCVLLFLYFN